MRILKLKLKKLLKTQFNLKISGITKYEKYSEKFDKNFYISRYGSQAVLKKNFLNVGCGPTFRHFAFRNVDNFTGKIDVTWSPCDFKQLPIEDNSIELIYNSHMIEHLTFKEALFMLKEFYRILKPNGNLRIITPNIDFFHRAYIEKYLSILKPNLSLEHSYVSVFAQRLVKGIDKTPKKTLSVQKIRNLFENLDRFKVYDTLISIVDPNSKREDWWNHISYWNHDILKKNLHKSGFKKIFPSSYAQSRFPVLRDVRYFDQTAPWYSFYTDVEK